MADRRRQIKTSRERERGRERKTGRQRDRQSQVDRNRERESDRSSQADRHKRKETRECHWGVIGKQEGLLLSRGFPVSLGVKVLLYFRLGCDLENGVKVTRRSMNTPAKLNTPDPLFESLKALTASKTVSSSRLTTQDAAQLVRASGWHAADAGSSPRCGKGGIFLPESTFSADSLTVSLHPRVLSHVLTSVRTLKIL